jgi:predicted AlkP superfamily pyrophosphatase or phosphodiesterase
MAHLTGKGSPEHVKARATLTEIRTGLKQEFQLAIGDEPEILGETLASPTVIVSAVGTITGDGARIWQGIYDYLCAVANHPTLRVFDFVERDAPSASSEVSDAFLARLARACLAVYLSALDATVHYYGWNANEINEFYDLVHSILPDASNADRPQG